MIIKTFKNRGYILFLIFGCLLYPQGTSAQLVPPPTLVSPGNGSINISPPVTLVWDHPSANMYRVQVATDASFSNLTIDVSGITDTYYELNTLASNTTYYWRVNATSLLITSDWSSIWNFTTSPVQTIPSTPVLVSPLNGTTDESLNPVLSWESVSSADYYRLQVAEDESFTSKVFDDSTVIAASYQVGPLEQGTQYYWRVNARNSAGASNWSSVWNFTTTIELTPPSAPVLVSPLNGTTDESLYPILSWDSVSTTNNYRLQVAEEASFNNTVYDDSTISLNYKQVGPLNQGTQYYWRVNAKNSAGVSNWSVVWNFTTTNDENLVPLLISPDDGLRNLPLTTLCVWDSVHNAQRYQVQVSTQPDFSSLFVNDSITITYIQLENLASYTTYFWRVRAKVNNNWQQYCAPWQFTTRSSTPVYINIDTTIAFPFYEDLSKYKSSDYKIIGIPGTSYIPIINFLPGTKGEDWQAYWDKGSPADYLIGYNENDFFYSIGKAFWIIKRGSMQIAATIEDAPLNNKNNVEVPLHSGWNLITNPLTYPVPWDSVKAHNNITEPIYSFDGSYNISQMLLPFKGFYFFNSTNLSILEVPSEISTDKFSAGNNYLAKLINNKGWVANIKLKADEYVDSIAWFGVSSLVNKDFNYFDIHKPRNWGSMPTVYFSRPEWDEDYPTFASDIRPLFDDSSEWTFEIMTTAWKPVSLIFNLKEVPDHFDIFLFNTIANKWINLKENTSYQFTPVTARTAFKVIVGKDIKDKLAISEPKDYNLGNNFPNPFNLSTTIPVTIPEKSDVEIAVFNVLGNRIRTIYKGTLDAGQHWFRWDGTDDKGNVISSGVYLYRLSDNTKVNSMKKMMLVK